MSVTATQILPSGARALPPGHYRLKHVAKSEVVKVLTLRSTAISLGLTVVVGLLVTGLVANSNLHHFPQWYNGFDPTQTSLVGLIVAVLTGGVFGVMLITSEYSSGMIRSTLAATPSRPVLLAAKLGVTAVATIAFSELLSFASFFLGQAILSAGGAPSASLASAGALRAVTMSGLFIALVALMSFGFGLILRSTAGGISAFVAVIFVLLLVMHAISMGDVRYLPTNIFTNSITATVNQAVCTGPSGAAITCPIAGPLSPGIGLLLMALYATATLTAGAVLLFRRDA